MKLGSIGRSSKTVEDLEREAEEQRMEAVHAARLERARENWNEIDPPVRRPMGLWVDVASDQVFRPFRGEIWVRGKADPVVGENRSDLAFFVSDGRVVVVEKVGTSWSEVVRRRASKGATA